MGLDMYLRMGGEDVIQWRKANSVHNWFAENVDQRAMESLAEVKVTRDDLIRLVDNCQEDLENYRKSHEENREYEPMYMKPTRGFFFGQYEVGSFWEQDLEETIEKVGRLLEETDGDTEFTYMSWW